MRRLHSKRLSLSRRLLFPVLPLILNCCTMVGPDYSPPDLNTAAQWLEADGVNVKPDSVELKDWWKIFNDPVLDSLIEAAYRQNLPLRVAGVRVLEARARLAIAVGEFWPQQQEAFASYSYNRISESAPLLTSQTADNSFQLAELGIGAAWELDFWGRFRRAIQSEDANLLSSMAAYDASLVSLLGDVANSYVVIRVLEEQLRIARANVKIQNRGFLLARDRFKGGLTNERDMQQALTQLRSTEATIPQIEISLQQARNALSLLLGMTPAQIREMLKPGPLIPIAPAIVNAGIPADLLRRRPDVRLAELTAVAQCARIGVAKAQLYPALSLNGSFGFLAADQGKNELGDLFNISSRTAMVGPSLVWPFLNYGQITNAVRVEDARFQEALISYQESVLIAQREVEDGLIRFVKSQETTGLHKQAVDAARKTLTLSQTQYQEGATDYTTVINAQGALLEQENELAQSRGAVPQGLISVYRALGGGWQIREGQDYAPQAIKEQMEERTNWGRLLKTGDTDKATTEKSLIRAPSW